MGATLQTGSSLQKPLERLMVRFRPTRLGRRIALLAAILFAALTLVASGPHHHGLRLPVAHPAAATAASHYSTSGAVGTLADCALCDWLATASMPSGAVILAVLPLSLSVLRARSYYATHRCSLPTPRVGLRAPPALSAA